MRNLIIFFWKNNFFFLFLLLEVFSFYLIISNNRFHNTGFFNSSNFVTGNVYRIYDDVTGYINLKNSNELLAMENAKLLSQAQNAFIDTRTYISQVTDSVYKQKYTYREAKVISNSINRRNNFITLDKGRNHGIEPLMGVIAPDGVVGIVKDVSDNFCSVLSLLNKNTTISSKLKKSGYLGSVTWEGGNSTVAELSDIPKHARVNTGDTVITSGASTIFPENIMVGVIDEIKLEDGDNFYKIKLILSTDFGKLSYVYIVNNLLKTEQNTLEEKTQNDN